MLSILVGMVCAYFITILCREEGEGGKEREGKRGSGGRDDNWLCSCVHAYNAFSLFYNMRGTVAYQLHVPADQQRQ